MSALLRELALLLQQEGLSEWLQPEPSSQACRYGELVTNGPRAAADRHAYALLVEVVYEGYLLHYGQSRVLAPDSPELALLLGDRLYALGLERVAELGDLESLAQLADIIGLSAQAQAAGNVALLEAVWLAGVVAIGWGFDAGHSAAKQRAFAGEAAATEQLLFYVSRQLDRDDRSTQVDQHDL